VTGSNLIAATTFGSVHGVLHSTAFNLAQKLTLLLAVIFWLGLAHWVYRDARRRMDDPLLVATAAALGALVPYVGALIYLLFRPPETLEDIRSRKIEVQALKARLRPRATLCPVCRTEVQADFRVCPVCTTQLKQPCAHCDAPLDRLWQICPYCATPVVAVAEPVAEDLDAALTAQVAANGKGRAKKPRAPARRAGTR
jgi:Double zinc ribbon